MKNNYLLSCLLGSVLTASISLSAQCPITVDAGEDIYACNPPKTVQLNGSIEGPYYNIQWTPNTGLIGSNTTSPLVNVNQTTTYTMTGTAIDESINLIYNGDFELGNVGFTSLHTYSPGYLVPLGTYDVLTNPESANDAFAPCDDHTTGSGKMMANNATSMGAPVWHQPVAVTPYTDYVLSGWATKLAGQPFSIYVTIGPWPITQTLMVPMPADDCEWVNFVIGFNSSSLSTIGVLIGKSKNHPSGNPPYAFALDDIVLHPACKVRDSVKVHVGDFLVAKAAPANSTLPCEGANITLDGSGSSQGPDVITQWETPDGNIVSGENTLHPVVNAAGTYTLSISAASGYCTETATVNVVESSTPLQSWITAPSSFNCSSPTVNLIGNSNQPANSGYQWTAGPGGNIVSGANSAIATINQPGDYTLLVTNTATGCTSESTISVSAPALSTASIQPPGILEDNTDTLTLTATASPPNAILAWTTPNGNIASGANTLNPLITAPGTYILTVTNPVNGCTGTDTVQVYKAAQCPITVNAGEDFILCEPLTPAQLDGEIGGNYVDFKWTPTAPLVYPQWLKSNINLTQTTSFVLSARSFDPAINLIVNPDFEQGNTSFTSSLLYNPGDLVPGTYDVLTDPENANDTFYPCGDHTTGSGQMLAANTAHNSIIVWCQTVPVTPNTDYYFSYWAANLNETSSNGKGLSLYINNMIIQDGLISLNFIPACEWENADGIWNSGSNTSATLCIQKTKPAFGLAIDDIFFGPTCEEKDTVTVYVENLKAIASPAAYTIPCEGYELTLSGAGSTLASNVTYQWDTQDGNIISGQNTLYPVINSPGTYTLTVSLPDGIGSCTKTATVKVNSSNELYTWISPPQAMNCFNPNTLLVGNSSLPATSVYQWTAGPGGNIVSGEDNSTAIIDQPGEYTLVVTNTATGCVVETSVNIAPPVRPFSFAIADPITCSSPQTTLFGTGSSVGPNFTQLWSTINGHIVSGHNEVNAVADAPGVYIHTVTLILNGCSRSDTVIVTANAAALPVNVLAADTITCLQNAVTLSTDSATAGAHRSYLWKAIAGGNIVSGADSLSPVVNAPGLYILLVTDTLNACTGTDTVAVAADNDAVIAIANSPTSLTCLKTTVILDADGSSSNPMLLYQWSTSDGHIVTGGNTPTPTVDAPGTYTLLLSDPSNGCSATDAAEVTQNIAAPELDILPPMPLTCAQPLLTVQAQNTSPAGSFSYDWTAANGGHIFAGDSTLMLCVDAGGTYTLFATNLDNGCTSAATVEVSTDFAVPDLALSVSGTLNCNAASVNLLNSSATDPALLDHQWTLPDGSGVSTGAVPNLAAAQPGVYNLLLSNTQNGCTGTASVTVVQHDNVTATLDAQQNNPCFGASDGALGITAGGGNGAYTYLWSNNANTPGINNLSAGTYTITITDGENCTATLSATVTEPAELVVAATATPPSTVGASDGTATANPQGGTTPYIFAWDNGKTTQTITGLAAGFYTVTVTDVNGCTAVETVEVWGGDCAVSATLQAVDPLCHGAADGQATALPLGGSAPYTYLWTSGSTDQTATGLAAGVHGVTLTDANGCAFSGTVSLADPALLTLIVDNTVDATCPNSSEGSATVLAGGGTGATGIEWSNGQSGPTATGLSAGTYTATATDANGCTATATANIEAIDQEPPLIVAGPVNIPLGPSGSVELTLQNLGAAVTDNCAIDAIQIAPDEFDCFDLGEQQVSITAQDESGNSSSKTITVTLVDIQVPVLECPASITRCAADNQVEYAAPVAIDNCLILGGTFNLVTGLPSGSPFPQGTTTNAYTYTDASGNTGACDFQVTILSPLTVGLDKVTHDIDHQNIGSIEVTVGGSQPGYTYEWLKDGVVIATTEDISGIGAGVYTLWVTDAAGCKTEAGPFEVSSLVKTDNPAWAEYIAVYPNPSSGRVFAVLPDELVNAEVDFEVFDVLGRRVLEQRSIRDKRVELDMSNLADGLYSVLVRMEQGQAVWKVVVNK